MWQLMLLCLLFSDGVTGVVAKSKAFRCSPVRRCEDGWKYFQGKCYSYFTDELSWEEAEVACGSSHAQLVAILNKGIQVFIEGLLRYSGNDHDHWIGLHNDDSNGRWMWLNNPDDMKYKNWMSETPWWQEPAHGACGLMIGRNTLGTFRKISLSSAKVGMWIQADCDEHKRFVCGKPLAHYRYKCDGSWQLYNEMCIQGYRTSMAWSMAQQVCKKFHPFGDLLTIESTAKQRFVNGMVSGHKANFWTGLNYDRETGKWRWLNEINEADYSNWGPSLPDSNSIKLGVECSYMIGRIGTETGSSDQVLLGMWYHAKCETRLWFICQKPAETERLADTTTPVLIDVVTANVAKVVRNKLVPQLRTPTNTRTTESQHINDQTGSGHDHHSVLLHTTTRMATSEQHDNPSGGGMTVVVVLILTLLAMGTAVVCYLKRYRMVGFVRYSIKADCFGELFGGEGGTSTEETAEENVYATLDEAALASASDGRHFGTTRSSDPGKCRRTKHTGFKISQMSTPDRRKTVGPLARTRKHHGRLKTANSLAGTVPTRHELPMNKERVFFCGKDIQHLRAGAMAGRCADVTRKSCGGGDEPEYENEVVGGDATHDNDPNDSFDSHESMDSDVRDISLVHGDNAASHCPTPIGDTTSHCPSPKGNPTPYCPTANQVPGSIPESDEYEIPLPDTRPASHYEHYISDEDHSDDAALSRQIPLYLDLCSDEEHGNASDSWYTEALAGDDIYEDSVPCSCQLDVEYRILHGGVLKVRIPKSETMDSDGNQYEDLNSKIGTTHVYQNLSKA